MAERERSKLVVHDAAQAGSLHGLLLAIICAVAVGFSLLLIWLGAPLLEMAFVLVLDVLILLPLRLPARLEANTAAVFGNAEFIATCRARATPEGQHLTLAASPGDAVADDLRHFLAEAGTRRCATVIIQLSPEDGALAARLPRLVEGLSALVLLAVPAEEADPGPHYLGLNAAMVAPRALTLPEHLAKRTLDLLIAVPAMALLSPLLLAIAIAIRIDSPGGALFRQTRIGRNGRPFTMYKFRSMLPGDDGDGSATQRHDPRVTRLGHWLRSTSLDELPQLINVTLGSMSIVGPRPHIATHRVEDGIFTEMVPEYAIRHRVTPGITGLAQISGMRGGIQTLERARRNVSLDLSYIRHWSLGFDIRIILRTLSGGMVGRDVF
jgi:putative colanic acid biosynthesis UDP-glucose lipid carrier transferase